MNEEQSGPDWLAGGSGPPDLDRAADQGGSPAGHRGAIADDAWGSGTSASGIPESGAAGQAGSGQSGSGQSGSGQSGSGQSGSGQPDWSNLSQGGAPAAAPAQKRPRSTWRELPILIVVALAIALVIKTFVVQPFFIPSSSMEDTLLIGDKVLVNKLVYHFRSIEPGDIIVFNGAGSWNPSPAPTPPAHNPVVRGYDATLRPLFRSIAGLFGTPLGQTDYIKRVIGVPGDHVVCNRRCADDHGPVTVNGIALHESSYLYPGAAPSQIQFNIVVPPGRLWVMGDNRAISDDSRLRMTDPGRGTIPENEVIGRAFVIVWPPSRWRFLPIPSTFDRPGIDRPRSSAQALQTAARESASQQPAASALLGTKVQPEGPYLPLAAGLVGAVPLTWLQRRARRRLSATRIAGRLRAGRGSRRE